MGRYFSVTQQAKQTVNREQNDSLLVIPLLNAFKGFSGGFFPLLNWGGEGKHTPPLSHRCLAFIQRKEEVSLFTDNKKSLQFRGLNHNS